ncbi:MAG: hypothetical protein A2915_01130 [Candidatus Yanofskybacteria bacterium RIFCSPLOWO2_01_FULL_41_34]|nr:MAG: hypothetical protein A2915_01130 [Candidatus Yanofskybacteria bacterium RIFCSPLOWO2_01_FULL_41_34]
MKQSRIENLADGIFAIVMTLLVLEIKVPIINVITEYDLTRQLFSITPLFFSYILSFALLYTYWKAHHSTISLYAKNVDDRLSNQNAFFLMLIALVPFTSNFLGQYNTFRLPVVIFALHIVAIGLSLFKMRLYVKKSETVENNDISKYEENHAQARILVPVFCALIAIFISFYSTQTSLVFLTLGILFNLSRRSTRFIFSIPRILGIKVEG